jgi:hypothetical protein
MIERIETLKGEYEALVKKLRANRMINENINEHVSQFLYGKIRAYEEVISDLNKVLK